MRKVFHTHTGYDRKITSQCMLKTERKLYDKMRDRPQELLGKITGLRTRNQHEENPC